LKNIVNADKFFNHKKEAKKLEKPAEPKKEETPKKDDKKVEEPQASFIKAKDDQPKMAHPSTTSPPLHMTHS